MTNLVSAILAGSWRQPPPPWQLSPIELDQVTPLLYQSGAAGLGWWRVSQTEMTGSPSADLLHQAFRLQTLHASINAGKIKKVFALLRSANIEPILFKGWSVARYYPQPGLRASGDIDILVHPRHLAATTAILQAPEARDCWVDLHHRLDELEDRKIDDLFARSQLVNLDEEQVRVLQLEDHLGLLAVHLLKHGAWRPLWLCDLGVILDSLPDDFDWGLCFGKDRVRRNWITSAIGLAQLLLDARVKDPVIAEQASRIPMWLGRSVLKQWEAPLNIRQEPMNHMAPMSHYLRRPKGVLRDMANRWPNPILATITVKGRFNRIPRLPYQLGNCLLRAAKFATSMVPGAANNES
ncbi:MAG: nucleotidyltransferase family protein [Pyrinomonadaceae bacterium]